MSNVLLGSFIIPYKNSVPIATVDAEYVQRIQKTKDFLYARIANAEEILLKMATVYSVKILLAAKSAMKNQSARNVINTFN